MTTACCIQSNGRVWHRQSEAMEGLDRVYSQCGGQMPRKTTEEEKEEDDPLGPSQYWTPKVERRNRNLL